MSPYDGRTMLGVVRPGRGGVVLTGGRVSGPVRHASWHLLKRRPAGCLIFFGANHDEELSLGRVGYMLMKVIDETRR